ncbi:MAG: putative DNA binding domain-containing protein [Ignavibacteria bacterium]|nr:putative DNA binding domain-containing protein [Ignavibacteria bacterium]
MGYERLSNLQYVKQTVKLKESEIVEFKKSTGELKEALKSISAILNKHQKGELYFGIKNDGSPIKAKYSVKTLRDISQSISHKIEPKIYPSIELSKISSIEVIKITLEGHQIPYSAEGRYYIRVADEDKQLSADELKRFIINHQDIRWDKTRNDSATLKDIDHYKVKAYCKQAEIKFTSLSDVLDSLNLLASKKPLNACVVLFSKKPEKFFSNTKLMCSIFATTNTAHIIDQKEFTGDLFYLLHEAENYILKNIHIGMKVDGLYRKDVPEIDNEALREVIINAFLHRDYFNPDFISIGIFKDRIEVKNPGGLFGGLSIQDIIKRNISKRRNEVIADVLSRAHYVERKGRGIALILEKEPQTKFDLLSDVFITTLERKGVQIDKGLVKGLVEGLVENQKKIVWLIYENPKISKSEIHKQIGISTTAIDKNIEKLKNLGILERIGPAKGGSWKIRTN